MIYSELYKRSLYLNTNYDYLFGNHIIEYDIQSAGLNIIKYYKLLPSDKITLLENMNKEARNKQIGLFQREDASFKQALSDGFVNIRKEFFDLLSVRDDDIISIKKDAIFLKDRISQEPIQIGNVVFVPKHTYSSYLYLNRKEFYINTRTNQVDVKGIQNVELHQPYFLDFIRRFASVNENSSSVDTITDFLLNFILRYRNMKLDVGYYRRLSIDNNYVVYDTTNDVWIEIDDVVLESAQIDISYNYIHYLLPMVSMYI